MIHKQKKRSAWLCACTSLAFSLLIWTAVVSRIALGTFPDQVHSAAPSLLEGVIRGMGDSMHDLTGSILETPVVDESPRLHDDSHGGDTAGDEAADWGIAQKYTLSIPAISMRAPVQVPSRTYWDARKWSLLEQQMQVGLRNGVVAYPHSPEPGERGSLIIAGHSSPPDALAADSDYSDIFARLPELTMGDKISVNHDGLAVRYEVTGSTIVSPSHTEILRQQTEKGVLKLITCYPVGTTKDRMIITAKQI